MADTKAAAMFSIPVSPKGKPYQEAAPISSFAPEATVLELKKFAGVPTVDLGELDVNRECQAKLNLVNNNEDTQILKLQARGANQDATLQLFNEAGDNLETEEMQDQEFAVEGSSTIQLTLSWKPVAQGGLRQKFTLLWNGRHRLQFIVAGSAFSPYEATTKTKHKYKVMKPFAKRAPLGERQNNIQAQMQNADLNKPEQTKRKRLPSVDVVRRNRTAMAPGPHKRDRSLDASFSSAVSDFGHFNKRRSTHPKNQFEAEERIFVEWCNDVLANKSSPISQGSQERQMLRSIRSFANELFVDEQTCAVIERLENEFESGRLTVNSDTDLLADYGIRDHICDSLMMYNALWLTAGLEVIMDTVVSSTSIPNSESLENFIQTHFLSYIQAAEGNSAATSQEIACRFFKLVFFLDRLKTRGQNIPGLPPMALFVPGSKLKSSREQIQKFTQKYLIGVGDVIRQLQYQGCILTYVQTPLDEYDFTVKSLSTDLRNGVILSKLMSNVSGNAELMNDMRLPAISRLQKIHNVAVALDALRDMDLDTLGGHANMFNVKAEDIVDGHREKTFFVLWTLLLQYKVGSLINEAAIEKEIEYIYSLRNDGEECQTVPEMDLYFRSEKLSAVLRWMKVVCAQYDVVVKNFTSSLSDGRAFSHLIYHYHKESLPFECIQQETTSNRTQELFDEARHLENDKETAGGLAFTFSPGSGHIGGRDQSMRVEAENQNWKLILRISQELQLLPSWCSSASMLVRPNRSGNKSMLEARSNERLMIAFACYLCDSLLVDVHRHRAARAIQQAWQVHKEAAAERRAAEIEAQRVEEERKLMEKLRRESAAVVIQRNCRRMWAMRNFNACRRAIIVLQSRVRCMQARKAYLHRRKVIICIQSRVRGRLIRQSLCQKRNASITIQRAYRAHALWRGILAAAAQFRIESTAAITLQCAIRGFFARRTLVVLRIEEAERQRVQFEMESDAAVKIQCAFRSYQARQVLSYLRLVEADRIAALRHHCALIIQCAWRQFLARRELLQIFEEKCAEEEARLRAALEFAAARTIQCAWRQFVAHRNLIELRTERMALENAAVTTIAANWRCTVAQRHYQRMRGAVVLLQAQYRSLCVSRAYNAQRKAAIVLQCRFRGVQARNAFTTLRQAAIVVQTRWRATLQRRAYLALRQRMEEEAWAAFQEEKSIIIQSAFRGYWVRKEIANMCSAATKIQSQWRCYSARATYQTQLQAVVSLQCALRGLNARRTLAALQRAKAEAMQAAAEQAAAIVLQSNWRRVLATRELAILQQIAAEQKAATVLQAHWRRVVAMRQLESLRLDAAELQATIVLQCAWRRLLATRELAVLRQHAAEQEAAIVLQSAWRRVVAMRELAVLRQDAAEVRAAVVVQSHWRRVVAQGEYECMRWAACVVQAHWRHILLCRRENRAAVVIQAVFRGHKTRRQMALYQAKRVEAVETIANALYSYVCRQRYLHLRRAAQFVADRYAYKLYLRSVYFRDYAALKIQALWRGYRVRKTLNRKGLRVLQRLRQANAAATADKRLGNRMRTALNHLLDESQMTKLIESCKSLEVVARLSESCCDCVVEHGAISILFRLTRSCNRSKPHMELLKHILATLSRISAYEQHVQAILTEVDGLNTIVELLQMYRDKDEIFVHAARLMVHLATHEVGREVITSDVTLMSRLRKIDAILTRRRALQQRRLPPVSGRGQQSEAICSVTAMGQLMAVLN
eukprot:Clim_evm64s142 gene=Clim_evmTU64s142